MTIDLVQLNRTDIRRNLPAGWQNGFTLTNAGAYTITVSVNPDNIYQFPRRFTFSADIRSTPNMPFLVGTRNNGAEFGTSVTTPVDLFVNPTQIYSLYRDSEVIILRDGILIDTWEIGPSGFINKTIPGEIVGGPIMTLEEAGDYQIFIINARGDVLFAEGFRIEETISSFTWIFIIAVFAALGIGVLIFWRLRRRIAVK
jgi:hypothetical protein